MDLKEIEERWKDKQWFPINPHKDIGWLISRVKDLESDNEDLQKQLTVALSSVQYIRTDVEIAEASNKKLREAIDIHENETRARFSSCVTEDDERLWATKKAVEE